MKTKKEAIYIYEFKSTAAFAQIALEQNGIETDLIFTDKGWEIHERKNDGDDTRRLKET